MAKKTVRTKKVMIGHYSGLYSEIPLNNKLSETIQAMQALIDKAPLDYRDSVEIDTDLFEEYGSYKIGFDVFYYRPMTKEELKEENDNLKACRSTVEHGERAQLARLLAKYGSTTEPDSKI